MLQYLHKPRKEEYESDEIEVGTPAGKAVNCSVHEEHPALLGGGLVDCEDTGAWQERGEQAALWWAFDIKKSFPRSTINIDPLSLSQGPSQKLK